MNQRQNRRARTQSFNDLIQEAKDYTPGINRKYYNDEQAAKTDELSCYREAAVEIVKQRKVLIPNQLPKPMNVLIEGFKLTSDAHVKRTGKPFVIDDNNRDAMNQLFAYFTYDTQNFRGDFSKGLLIVGGVGSGKTTAMQIFKQWIINSNLNWAPWNRDFTFAKCSDIALKYSDADEGGEKFLKQFTGTRMYCFDDLGKELEGVKNVSQHFGNKLNVMAHILEMRYDLFQAKGIKTFATTNHPLISKDGKHPFLSFYGEYIEDRMKEMFNVITFYGPSRRK